MKKREPNFDNMLKVLKGELPERPTLFELFMNDELYSRLAGEKIVAGMDPLTADRICTKAFYEAGFDYVALGVSNFSLDAEVRKKQTTETVSWNDSFIPDWEALEKFHWMDPASCDKGKLERIKPYLPDGMKVMAIGRGILEWLEALVGYENLCLKLYDDPEFVQTVTDKIGEKVYRYFEGAVQYDSVGFLCITDDWGFNTQTLLSAEAMRKYVFPWTKKIVELSHRYNKPIVLHSCGYFENVIEDIIEELKFDGRHSYEDNITPVETAYEKYGDRLAILGGMDVDYMCRASKEELVRRSRNLIEMSAGKGRFALGSGSSVPSYVPQENYLAILNTVREYE